MEQEALLLDQIETYVDRLVLLGMQEKIDEKQVREVNSKIVELTNSYMNGFSEQTEVKLHGVESVFASTLEEEAQKRRIMLSIIHDKKEAFASLFLNVGDIAVASSLKKYVAQKLESFNSEVRQYEDDVKLVEEQIEAIKNAVEMEKKLREEIDQAKINVNTLRNSQVSYSSLNKEALESYQEILRKGNVDSIDFSELRVKKEVLKKRQKRLRENLELARKTKNAQNYVKSYEGKANENRLEIDEIEEQEFLHILRKWIETAQVTSYETLQKRTNSIQELAQSRMEVVEKLYQNGVVSKDKYRTLAEQVNHTKIFNQLRDLEVIQKNEESIASIAEQLNGTRKNIKDVEELEAIFAQRAEERGRHAVIPEAPASKLGEDTQAEVLPLEGLDDFVNPQKEVVTVTPASKSLLAKASSFMQRLKNKILKYSPSIGDKIQLKEGAHIFSHPSEAFVNTTDQHNSVLNQDLFVTRGVIIRDQTKDVVYIGTDYGTDLVQIAQDMNLPLGSYHIILGCSIGDEKGNFIGVSEDLNSKIEKGWVNASDPNIVVVEQLSQGLNKGVVK